MTAASRRKPVPIQANDDDCADKFAAFVTRATNEIAPAAGPDRNVAFTVTSPLASVRKLPVTLLFARFTVHTALTAAPAGAHEPEHEIVNNTIEKAPARAENCTDVGEFGSKNTGITTSPFAAGPVTIVGETNSIS